MKKKFIATAGLILIACAVVAADPGAADQKSTADQKWLTVVKKIVEKGETKLSTPSESRVKLLKSWADKNGYSVTATKTETGFKLDIVQSAQNVVKN